VSSVVATKGKKVLRMEFADDSSVKEVVIGPSGNLRAPALIVDRTLVVGFDEGLFQEMLGRV
jgi:hypothetical protein